MAGVECGNGELLKEVHAAVMELKGVLSERCPKCMEGIEEHQALLHGPPKDPSVPGIITMLNSLLEWKARCTWHVRAIETVVIGGALWWAASTLLAAVSKG